MLNRHLLSTLKNDYEKQNTESLCLSKKCQWTFRMPKEDIGETVNGMIFSFPSWNSFEKWFTHTYPLEMPIGHPGRPPPPTPECYVGMLLWLWLSWLFSSCILVIPFGIHIVKSNDFFSNLMSFQFLYFWLLSLLSLFFGFFPPWLTFIENLLCLRYCLVLDNLFALCENLMKEVSIIPILKMGKCVHGYSAST